MEKINIAELLKDCPKDMELDCVMFDNMVFEKLEFSSPKYPVVIRSLKTNTTICLTEYGQYIGVEDAKCVIFPKGRTTWEGFVPPCKFKDGDIVATNKGEYVFMLKKVTSIRSNSICDGTCYCAFRLESKKLLAKETNWYFSRLATEEEKAELFQAIKDNGYKWNEETKTLENLIEPKFKVGNKIKEINSNEDVVLITDITDDYYIVETEYCMKVAISINMQNNYELVPNKFDINTLVPFDSRVLVRHDGDNKWRGSFFSHIDEDFHSHCYKFVTTAGKSYPMCIPYEGNEHLIGKTGDCDEYYKTWK